MSAASRAGFLHIEDLYKSYGPKRVLDNVDLSVGEGELCTLVGPSGCGKSTLLRQILGEEFPDAGRVTIEGVDVGHPDPRRGIVFQRYSSYPHLSVLDNVVLGLRLQCSPLAWLARRKALREEALDYLRRVRLAEHADKYPHQLSGGMQQRVAIAQALILRPRVLLMDEPFGALDPDTREQMQLFLLELWERERMTVFFVTHDLEEAVYLGTRILVLSQYYHDQRGEGAAVNRGAKIIADYQLPRAANATDVKRDPAFAELVERIRREGFDPSARRHVAEFNLQHPHSFRTLTAEENG
ncbi:ABC transporter ATP-binding protein [Hydrocarboniphaga sp.]|uniref:ABC transporter ATP-binding protein n=1 Tax=Hydrocarboniphaga sp. TaxID=2033016 RepID=UPI003D095C4B